MRTARIISLIGLAASTKMPASWLRKKADEGAIPCVQVCDGEYRFLRRAAVKAVERLVERGEKK